jgi:plastocyanin
VEELAVRLLRFSIMVGAVLAFAAACGGAAAPTGGRQPATAAAGGISCNSAITQANVNIVDFAYNPNSVTIAATQTVTWANGDSTAHTVTFDSGPDCGNVAAGSSLAANFGTAGSFPYHCTIHPQMKGTVVVQ